MNQDELTKTRSLSEIGEDIGFEEGTQLVNAFREANPEAVPGYFIGRNILDQILNQPGCEGIRYRKCLHEGQEHLVYTGVDAEGNDILEYSAVAPTGDIITEKGIVADRVVIDWDAFPTRPTPKPKS